MIIDSPVVENVFLGEVKRRTREKEVEKKRKSDGVPSCLYENIVIRKKKRIKELKVMGLKRLKLEKYHDLKL